MKDTIAYHGSNSKVKQFSVHKISGNDQYGPGIYLTDDSKTAKTYGKNLHICKVDTKRMLSKNSRVNIQLFNRILNENVTKDHLDNWDYTREQFLKYWNENVFRGQPVTEILEYIWKDIFDLDNQKFCSTMVRYGIDGTIHPLQTKEHFFVVYNPKIITIESVITL